MFKDAIIRTLLPTFFTQLENGVVDDFLTQLREDYQEYLNEDETVEILQTMESVNGLKVAMLNIVALNEDCYIRVIKQFTLKEIVEIIKTKI